MDNIIKLNNEIQEFSVEIYSTTILEKERGLSSRERDL